MSFIKKGIETVGSFIKKHWKPIVIVAVSVFAMGLATVGFEGFSGAMGAADGGFGGFMSAVGSTMYAGVTAAAGTLGLGSGAAGTAAQYGGVEGAGLFSGHLAAALGSDSAQAGIAAQLATNAGAPGPGVALTGLGPAKTASTAPMPSGAPPVGGVTPPGTQITMPPGGSPQPPANTGFLGSDLAKAALITTAGSAASGFFAGKMAEEDDPLGYWGVDLTGEGNDVPPPLYQQQPPPNLFPSAAPQAPMVQAPMPQVPGLMNVNAPPQQAMYPPGAWIQPYGAGG